MAPQATTAGNAQQQASGQQNTGNAQAGATQAGSAAATQQSATQQSATQQSAAQQSAAQQSASGAPSGQSAALSASEGQQSTDPAQQVTGSTPTTRETPLTTPSWSTDPGAFISGTTQNSGGGGMSQPAIGGLVGGIVGAIALIIVAFVLWRKCRGRGEKVAPPPPREVSYIPPSTFGTGATSRAPSMSLNGHNRVGSYSTLLNQPRASSQYRRSYYSAYPADSPSSSIQHDQSPRIPSNTANSGSPSLSSSGGNTTPATGPMMVPSDGLDASTMPNGNMGTFIEHDGRPLDRGPSSDQLTAPADSSAESRTTGCDSRTSSPPPSIAGVPHARLPHRSSLGSLNGHLRYGAPRSGAPHHRQISITIPRPLSTASSDHPASPSGTYRSPYGSTRNTPRTSMANEFGAQMPMPTSPSHRRGPSASSRGSHFRPDSQRDSRGAREEIV